MLGLVAVASVAAYEVFYVSPAPSCHTISGGAVAKTQVQHTTFGAVTEYSLPAPGRWPNAVAAAPDGSVWFADEELPGVAHLYPSNGTLVEYAWPGYHEPKPPDCVPNAVSSGIALWNGRVWAADEFGNAIWGVSPGGGAASLVNVSGKADFPYWLAVGPDGDLWFTSNNYAGQPSRLGRILPNLTLEVVNLVGLGNDQPIQLDFVNGTLAFLSTLDQSENSTTHSCMCTGHIYSFDPSEAGASMAPTMVGGGYTLRLPTSLSYADGSVWVAQHGAASIVRYDFGSKAWTVFPTSLVSWSATTLPLVVQASGGRVWFNEHYANKIAQLDPAQGTLTEYAESATPVTDYNGIQNDLSISATAGGLWFTSLSGNYVGYVDASVSPGWEVAAAGANRAQLAPGGNSTFDIKITGSWATALSVNASDSENERSVPAGINIAPASSSFPAGEGPVNLRVRVQVGAGVAPGPYTLAVTLSGGATQQTVYVFIDVT